MRSKCTSEIFDDLRVVTFKVPPELDYYDGDTNQHRIDLFNAGVEMILYFPYDSYHLTEDESYVFLINVVDIEYKVVGIEEVINDSIDKLIKYKAIRLLATDKY